MKDKESSFGAVGCLFNKKEQTQFSFRNIKIVKDSRRELIDINEGAILFLLEGTLNISFNQYQEKKIKGGEMIFLPQGCALGMKPLTDVHAVLCMFDIQAYLCQNCRLDSFYAEFCMTEEPFTILPLKGHIPHFLSLLDLYIADGIPFGDLYELKKRELFMLLHMHYKREDLARFFYSTGNKNVQFKSLVMKHYLGVSSVKELAERINYSVSGFEKKFQRCFNESPYQWVINQKALHIWNELKENSKPLKEIALEYRFSSQSHFNEFCKRHYGLTPGKIRSGIEKKGVNV